MLSSGRPSIAPSAPTNGAANAQGKRNDRDPPHESVRARDVDYPAEKRRTEAQPGEEAEQDDA